MFGRVASVLLVLGLLPALLEPAPAVAGKQKEAGFKEWIDGPVLYIARKEETKAFRALDDDEDRALFIARFWARRDPHPETLTNEYRQLFWERVQYANDRFIDSARPGWKTDRGKIHILYGAPTEIQEELHLETDGLAAAGPGVIRWLYDGRPAGRMDLAPTVVVPFVRDSGGEYRVSYDPKLSSVFWDPLAIREGSQRMFASMVDELGRVGRSELSVMLDLGRMQEVPPQEQVLLESVETIETYRTHPVQTQFTRFLHPEQGETTVAVTVDVSHIDPGLSPAILARFEPQDGPGESRMLGEGSFKLMATERIRLAQGRIVLPPGRYELTVLVADPETAGTGMHRVSFDAPEASARLRIGDLVRADVLESLEYASMASHDEPFLAGPFRVIPKMDASYAPGEAVRLFFEVYGGQPPYRLSYQLEGRETDGSWVALGRPSTVNSAAVAQGWEQPTSARWPPGEYRIRIDVHDQADRLASSLAAFDLAEPGTP